MKNGALIFVGSKKMLLAITVIWIGLSASAYCQQPESTMLLLRQTPLNGGTITPDIGVHNIDLNSEITLTALPKPGYQFVYWLGDVGDPTSNSTTAYLDTPKIIIAVFKQIKYDLVEFEIRSSSAPGTNLRPGSADYSRQGGGAPGRRRQSGRNGFFFPPPEPPDPPDPPEPPVDDDFSVPGTGVDDDFPIPGTGVVGDDDFPVPDLEPVPEPATLVILGLGGLIAFTRRRHKTHVAKKN